MKSCAEGTRRNDLYGRMCRIAEKLTEQEIGELSAYYNAPRYPADCESYWRERRQILSPTGYDFGAEFDSRDSKSKRTKSTLPICSYSSAISVA